MGNLFNSSISRKIAMALSAFFLLIFLIIHLAVNITSLFSEEIYNRLSHFMGTNALVQFALQPVLVVGVIFHFFMGFILEYKNRTARSVKYVKYKGSANTTWVSRNMLFSGLVILAFLVIHFIDFWVPEISYKYIEVLPEDPNRYFTELQHKFSELWRVAAYCVAFILLTLHLLHGFQSAFQSTGFNNKYTSTVKKIGNLYAILIPLGFIVIALYHYLTH